MLKEWGRYICMCVILIIIAVSTIYANYKINDIAVREAKIQELQDTIDGLNSQINVYREYFEMYSDDSHQG